MFRSHLVHKLLVSSCVAVGLCAVAASAEVKDISFVEAGLYGNAATFQIALGDLDHDGDLDAVFANMGIESQIWINDGSGQFANSGQFLGAYAHGVAIGDIDGDGDLDLVFAQATTSFSSQAYLNNGTGRFTPSRHNLGDRVEAANSVALLDVDGDGDLDAGVYYANRYNRIYLNDGLGQFTPQEFTIPGMACWGDVDGDGDVDAIAQQHEGGYILFRNHGNAMFESSALIDAPTSFMPGGAAMGDIDRDGDLDLVGTSGGFDRITPLTLLKNNGEGVFTYTPEPNLLVSLSRISLGDFNEDGAADIFLGRLERPNGIGLNDGSGNFVDSGLQFGEDHMEGISALGDLDSDGDLDLFVAVYGQGGPNEVWLNTTGE